MNGKLIFLLLATLCVAQGSDVLAPENYPVTPYTIEDIVKLLNKFITSLQSALERLKKLINDIDDTIEDITGKIDIPGILQGIKKKVEEIIEEAGVDASIVANCVADEASAAAKLGTSIAAGVADCTTGFKGLRESIEKSIAALTKQVTSLIGTITSGMATCFKDHVLNPLKLLACLTELEKPISQQVDSLIATINKEIANNEQQIIESTDELSECVDKVGEDATNQGQAIIDTFQQCVDDIIHH